MLVTVSDPDNSNSAYDTGDTITIRFSEKTNKGELPDRSITREPNDNLLRFNLPLGNDYHGDWITCDIMRITILDVNPETPPALGILNVSVLPRGNLRN
jgi:hypothetical protein